MATTTHARNVGPATYFFGALGGLLFGYDLGVVAGALLFITPEYHLTDLQKGLVTSMLLVGAMVGALTAGRVGDRYGRRTVVLAAAVIFAVSALGVALAPAYGVILASRVVMGLAVGTASVTVPVYLSEIAPAHVRGRLSGLNQLMISSGILLAYLVSLVFAASGGWRWMFGLAVIPSALLFVGAYLQPESPRWLLKRGRDDEARAILASRGEADVDAELAGIRQVLTAERAQVGLKGLFADRRLLRILGIGAALAFLQQICGINTIVYYAPTILTGIGFGNQAAILTNAGLGALTVIVTVIMIMVIDRTGRRRPLRFGALGMTVAMVLLGVSFLSGGLTAGGAGGWVAVLGLAVFKISYSLSWGGVVWIMLGEIFPLRVRGTAMGVATFMNWFGNFFVGLFFPVLLGAISGGVFLVFAVLCLVAFGFASKFVPETKGRSLEQIEAQLGAVEVPARG